ncbi:DUF4956 domain-containing protein [Microgenomates group bacterium]|nr:DUF4956 domain-containing protein [Microgenomates group bacterium]
MSNDAASLLKETLTVADLSARLSWGNIVWALGTAILCGVIIYLVYRWFYRGTVYNDNFNALLVMATVTTCFIIMTISSNLVLSLGMVGALSIIRFRAAIKDPLDAGFIFLAIAAGLTAGAGLYLAALCGTIVVALVYIAFYLLGNYGPTSYLTIIRYDSEAEGKIREALGEYKHSLKSRALLKDQTELVIETKKVKIDELQAVLANLKGISSVSTVEYNGDYLG